MADKRISQLIERVDIANNDVLPIVASGATTTNKVTISTIQDWMQSNLDVGVTSVGLTMPSAFQVSGSPITTSGNINVTATGTASQYIRGDGSLADFPQGGGGGGASVSYYLNGSVSQGTIGGIAYLEMNKTPILGAGTDFTISSDGYIASFITDAGDPALLQIPAGNWNFETYLQASSGGGTPTFYIELYKVDSGGTATLIASNSGTPELIAFGTTINPYFSALAVPQTTLALTDRLALRYYVSPSGRTITLHTENNTLCQIITTFTTGLTALNGLTAQVQNFATGTSGTNFGISSSGSIHTFNLPDASASARGVVTTGSQIFGGVKTFADGLSLPSVGGTNQASRFVNIGTIHQGSGGSNQIGFNNSNNIYFGKGLDNGGVIQWSNSAVRYYTLPNADGTLALTSNIPANPVGGTGTTNQIPKFSGTSTLTNSNILDNGTEVNVQSRLFVTSGGQQFVFTPNLATTSNRIETTGSLPLEIVSGGNIRFGAGGATPQMTLATTGAVTLTGALNGTNATFTAAGSTFVSTITTGGSDMRISSGASAGNVGTFSNHPLSFVVNNSVVATIAVGGAATFSSSVSAGQLFLSTPSNLVATINSTNPSGCLLTWQTNGTIIGDIGTAQMLFGTGGADTFGISGRGARSLILGTNNTARLTIDSTGAATLSGALNGTSASFSTEVSARNGDIQMGLDSTYSIPFMALGWGGRTDASNKIYASRDSTSGIFINAATNRGISLLVNGGSTLALSLASTGAATFSSSVGIGAAPTGTYGTLSVSGGVSIKNDNLAKLEIGRYSVGAPNSYIKLGPNSNSLRVTNNTDLADIFVIENGGNVGINVTPVAWNASARAIDINRGSMYAFSSNIALSANAFFESSWKYKQNGAATLYNQDSGQHEWFSAGSGTAGQALNFTQTMTLDSSGRLGVGTPTPSGGIGTTSTGTLLDVYDGTQVGNNGGALVLSGLGNIGRKLNLGQIRTILTNGTVGVETGDMAFSTMSSATLTERMRITSGGNVGIGTNSPGNFSGVSFAGPFLDVTGVMQIKGTAANGVSILQFGGETYRKATIESSIQANDPYLAFGVSSSGSSSSGTERMRITSGGYLKASNTGTYFDLTYQSHNLVNSANGTEVLRIYHNGSSAGYGARIRYNNTSPNGTDNWFLYCDDSTALRAEIRSNGGLANYQSNNVNLSDERTKKDIEPLESYWDKFKEIEIVKFKYKDQTHDDFNIGVIAQQVEAVAPEFVDVDGWGSKPELDEEGNEIVSEEEPLKSIYTADLYHASIKVLQEAMAKIEKLEAEIESLKSQING